MSVGGIPARVPVGELSDEEALAATDVLLTQLTGIPRVARTFTVNKRDAAGRLRISPALLARMEALSLAEERDGETYFNFRDLSNVQHQLGGGPLTFSMLRLWPKMLKALPDSDPVAFEIGFRADCPDPGHPNSCDVTVVLPNGQRLQAAAPGPRGDALASLRVERPTRWPEVPQAAKDLIHEMRDFRFALIPRNVSWDWPAFTRRTGLADCFHFAQLITEEGNRRGLTMRVSFGLLITPPTAVTHFWSDIEVDGIWVPTDSLLINTLVSRGLLDRAAWPAHRSPGATLYPLARAYEPFICTHRGEPVGITMLSQFITKAMDCSQRRPDANGALRRPASFTPQPCH